jgi:hypothetical protein
MCIYIFKKEYTKIYMGDDTLIPKAQSPRKNKNNSKINFLDACEDEEDGFIEGGLTTDKVLSTFSFGAFASPQPQGQDEAAKKLFTQNETYTSAPRGLTPPINGEHFTVKRSYAMRPSTVRKLNALKTEHPDVNVLFNTIVDMALSHYYNYIFNEKGSFSLQEDKKVNS